MKRTEIVIKTKNRILNALVPNSKCIAEVLEKNGFSYDPDNVTVDGFLLVGEALHKPLKDLRLPEKIRVSVTAPKKEQEAV